MNDIINMLTSNLILEPEFIFVARVIVMILSVDVLAAILSAIVPLVKSVR